MRDRFASVAVGACLLMLALVETASAQESAAYRELLAAHVRAGRIGDVSLHVVDYAAIRSDPRYQDALRDLAAADPDALPDDASRLAFWINAYNLLAIRTVVDNAGVASIRDAGSFLWPVWRRPAGVVAGKTLSLDQIEHGILRVRFHDPRVHFAIVCASVSCPDLRSEPYDGARLPAELDDAARAFLSNPHKGLSFDAASGGVSVSSIFRWFADDFAAGGGVAAFLRAHAAPEMAARLEKLRDSDLSWLDYDWSLNDSARSR